MTEAEWLVCTDINRLIEACRGQLDDRAARRFIAACCRAADHRDGRSRWFATQTERFLADNLSLAAFQALFRSAWSGPSTPRWVRGGKDGHSIMTLDAGPAVGWVGEAPDPVTLAKTFAALARAAGAAEPRECEMFREAVLSPFRRVNFEPGWRTEQAILTAGAIDENGWYEQTGVLADALEDAGCTDPEVLGHLRRAGGHGPGCWAVALVRGEPGATGGSPRAEAGE